jgi:SAM-dependent methyltransferase
LMALPQNAVLLDVGCGNGSPFWFKAKRPDIYYVGLDIGDYQQVGKPSEVADEYILVSPDQFAAAIEKMPNRFDAIVSSHNIEHCAEPARVLKAMMNALNCGGILYLSTPCGASVKFPSRAGSLNFFDDSTHVAPVELGLMVSELQSAGGKIEYACKRYRPILLACKGLISEPYNIIKRKVAHDGATWALYGFESILWARKPKV